MINFFKELMTILLTLLVFGLIVKWFLMRTFAGKTIVLFFKMVVEVSKFTYFATYKSYKILQKSVNYIKSKAESTVQPKKVVNGNNNVIDFKKRNYKGRK